MGLAVLFLLLGMLASEVALFQVTAAGIVGATLLVVSAAVLGRRWHHERAVAPEHVPAPVTRRSAPIAPRAATNTTRRLALKSSP